LQRKQLPLKKFWSLKILARYFFLAFFIGIGVWSISLQNDWELGPASTMNWLLFSTMLLCAGLVYFSILKITGDPYLTDVLNRLRKRPQTLK
jgi:hypothetical protein